MNTADTEIEFKTYQETINALSIAASIGIRYSSVWGDDYDRFFNAVANHNYSEYMRLINSVDVFRLTAHHESVLHIAIMHNNVFVMEDLMARLSDEQKKQLLLLTNNEGQTAITLAAHLRRNATVQLLLKHGSHPLEKDGNNQSAADYALLTNNLKLFQLLEEHCPELKSQLQDISKAYGKCASYLQGPEQFKVNGELLQAIANKDLDALKMAIAQHANVNTHDGTRRGTPLIRAIDADCPFEFIEALSNAGANTNATNASRQTALMIALLKNKTDAAMFLLQQPNIDISIHDTEGNTAVDYARTNELKLLVLDKLIETYPKKKQMQYMFVLAGIIEEELEVYYEKAHDIFQKRLEDSCQKQNSQILPSVSIGGFGSGMLMLQGIAQEGIKLLSTDTSAAAQKKKRLLSHATKLLKQMQLENQKQFNR